MQGSTKKNSAAEKTAAMSPLVRVIAQEHWFPAFLLLRKACRFELGPNGNWPNLKGHGLPASGLSVLSVFGVVVDDSRWWLRLFGLTTLTVKKRDDEKVRLVPAFIGRTRQVQDLKDAVLSHTQVAFNRLGRDLAGLVDAFEQDQKSLFSPLRYVRHSQLTRLLKTHERLTSDTGRKTVNVWLRHPMHVPDHRRQALDIRIRNVYAFLNAAKKARTVHNLDFVATQSTTHAPYFKNVENSPLTAEQIEASLHFDDANVTVAAAGSGKTSVIVSKVGYALKSGMLQQHEIIVLAFNKSAAKELRERISISLKKAIDYEVKVEARTFHSLGLSLWMKQQRMLGLPSRPRLIDFEKDERDAELDEEDGKRSIKGKRLLRAVLLELATDPQDRSFAKAVMKWADTYRFPTPELDPCDDQTLQEREARYYQMCRRIARRKGAKAFDPNIPTFDPKVWVRSTEEARLCNWLYLRHVPFDYEHTAPDWLTGKINAELPIEEHVKFYRPDFRYTNPKDSLRRIFHEHFGLDQNGRAPAFMGRLYEERARHKRAVLTKELGSRAAGIPSRFIETTSSQFADGTIFIHLEHALKSCGIPITSPDPLRWETALKTFLQEESVVDFIAIFLMKFRDSGLTMNEVQTRMQRLKTEDSRRADSFLQWMKPLLARLEKRMQDGTGGAQPRPLLDYAGMLGGAIAALKSWPTDTLPYKLVLVDEFQDISRLRAQLVQGLLDQNPDTSMLFCVGDDWQSINRFAGSDVGIFRKVYDGLRSSQVGSPIATRYSAQSLLKKTFRCPQGIADVAHWFVMKGGRNTELIDKPVASEKIDKMAVVRVVEHGDSGAERWAALELQLDLIAKKHLASGRVTANVFILMRNKKDNSLPEGIDAKKIKRLAKHYARQGINVSRDSMHGSKGLGAEYVILVGMDSGKGGYPGDFWNDPLIDAILPPSQSPVDEERRLFYVALTRTKVEATILCVGERPSPFVYELEQYPEEGVIVFEKLPGVVRYLCPRCEQSWLKRSSRPGRVECMRTPFCVFVWTDQDYPGLPENSYQKS